MHTLLKLLALDLLAWCAKHIPGDEGHIEGLEEFLQGLELVRAHRMRNEDQLEAGGQLIDVELVLRRRVVAEALQWLG